MSTTIAQTPLSYEHAPLSPIHRKVIAGGMLGQFSDGYILGIIGIAMSLATASLGLTTYWLGLIGAASLIGLLLGSLFVGPLADRIGRKNIYYTTMLVFFLASILQFFVTDPLQLLLLRLALGVAIGADYAAGLTLVSEWTPTRLRGRTMSFLMVMWVSGYVCAYAVGYFLQFLGDDAWRWILVSCAVPSVVALMIRVGTPESPLWLTGKGRTQEALAIIQKYVGQDYTLPVYEAPASKASWFTLFSPSIRRNTFVGSVFFACQVIPYFALGTFLPRVLQSLNVENPYASGIVYNLFLFIGVLFGMWVINKITRRAFLMGSFYICALALFVMSVWTDMPAYYALAALSVFSLVISAASVLEFAYPPELFPTELRASGVGFAVAISRLGGAAGTFFLPILMESFGTPVALLGCVASLLVGGVVCQLFAPETGVLVKSGAHAGVMHTATVSE